MHVNFHLPFWQRAGTDSLVHQAMMRFYDVIPAGLSELGAAVTMSKIAYRADTFGPDSFAICHHSCLKRRRNLNVKNSYLPNFLYLDRRGYSGWSEITDKVFDPEAIDPVTAETFYQEKLWSGLLDRGVSKYPQPAWSPDLPDDAILITLQVPGDSSFKLSRLSQSEIVEALIASDLRPLVIKPHPMAILRFADHLPKLMRYHDPQDGVFVARGNLKKMIEAARLVVCTNSGAGLEALLYGKRVVTCGLSDYHHITVPVSDRAGLVAACRASPLVPTTTMHRYAWWYFGQQMLDMRDDPEALARETLRRLHLSA